MHATHQKQNIHFPALAAVAALSAPRGEQLAGAGCFKGWNVIMKKLATPKRTHTKTALERFPVPEWMSPEVAAKAKSLDPCTRVEIAESLEHAAAQLRNFKPPYIKYVATATVHLRPAAKEAVLFYGRKCAGEQKFDEQDMLNVSVRWLLEEALCLLETVHEFSERRIAYRDAEDMEDSVQTEDIIRAALEKFKARFNCEEL